MKFDGTEMKSRSDNSPKNKVKTFHENLVVVEEEWFSEMNLTDSDTSPPDLIKREQLRFNQKNNLHLKQSYTFILLL